MEYIQSYIEQTYLSPFITAKEVEEAIETAKKYEFVGLCLPPYWMKKAKRELKNIAVNVVTVVGFPLGYHKSEVKLQELKSAIKDGADEIDVVVNLSAIKTGAFHWIKIEMMQLATLAHENEKLLKVILETASLTEEEIRKAAKACIEGGVDFLKTSTGFAKEGGATLEAVKLLRDIAPETVGIKASGGIRNLAQAQAMIEAGAERLGTSAGVQIIEESLKAKA